MKKVAVASNRFKLGVPMTLALALLAMPSAGSAATIPAKYKQNAAGVCQPALPSGAGSVLRARPMAVQNEGTNNAFVSCSLPFDDDHGEGPTTTFINALGVRLINNGPVAVSVSCTLVDGDLFNGNPTYLVKTQSVDPGALAAIIWNQFEYPAPQPALIARPNISCALPPKAGLAYVYYYYNRQVGDLAR